MKIKLTTIRKVETKLKFKIESISEIQLGFL